jgi:hypothetical protein
MTVKILNELRFQMHNLFINLNKELDSLMIYKLLNENILSVTYSHQRLSKSAQANKPFSKFSIDKKYHENAISMDNTSKFSHLDPVSIAIEVKNFLKENKIKEQFFYQKILRTSYLTFKNLVDLPQPWTKLNLSFKLYYKRAYIFLNDPNEKRSVLNRNQSFNSIATNDNFIHYDISQIEIKNLIAKTIQNVIQKLKENGLNRKILCDAVLGIPLNTLSFFCKKAKNWSDQSDYAKETVMRMQCWLYDPLGVKKLSEWKKSYYTSTYTSIRRKTIYYNFF